MPEITTVNTNPSQPFSASRADRPLSFNLADFNVPTGREEEWRFTPVHRLQGFFGESAGAAAPAVTLTGDAELEEVDRSDSRLGQLQAPEDRTGALAWEGFEKAYVLTIPKGKELEGDVELTIRGDGRDEEQVSATHILINAEAGSRATVVLSHDGVARLTEGVEISVGDGAQLTFVTVQEWDDGAEHMLSERIRVGRDAVLKHIVVSLGGDIVRVTTSLDYTAPGGDVALLGAYFADADQHLEHRLFVDHNHPHTRSNAVYKGALQGKGAHSVWVGDVLIRPEAEGINTYELNRNLVLTEGARADSVPNLEIETGEIEGAGHASATGRFDDEQLFYLLSRGIPEKDARRLVVRGFFAELINQIGVESIQAKLMDAIEKELELTALVGGE